MGDVVQFIPRTEHLVRDLSEPVVIVPLPVEPRKEEPEPYNAKPCDCA